MTVTTTTRGLAAAAAVAAAAALLSGCSPSYPDLTSEQFCDLLTADEARGLLADLTDDPENVAPKPDTPDRYSDPGCHFEADGGTYVHLTVTRLGSVKADPDPGITEVDGEKAYERKNRDGCGVAVELGENRYFQVFATSYKDQDDCPTAGRAAKTAFPRFADA
jgi:hypothetical protein